MNRTYNYKIASIWFLMVALILGLLSEGSPLLMTPSILCVVLAVFAYVSHVGQQVSIEVYELRKRLDAIDDDQADKPDESGDI